jgi:hypothetical protein
MGYIIAHSRPVISHWKSMTPEMDPIPVTVGDFMELLEQGYTLDHFEPSYGGVQSRFDKREYLGFYIHMPPRVPEYHCTY